MRSGARPSAASAGQTAARGRAAARGGRPRRWASTYRKVSEYRSGCQVGSVRARSTRSSRATAETGGERRRRRRSRGGGPARSIRPAPGTKMTRGKPLEEPSFRAPKLPDLWAAGPFTSVASLSAAQHPRRDQLNPPPQSLQPTFPHPPRKSLDARGPQDAPVRIHGMEHIQPLPPPSPTGPFEPERPSVWRRIGAAGLAIGALIANFAAKLKLLLVALPKLKLLTTSGSMLVSIAAYSLFFGWTFAVGFVLLLLVHEMGHVIQLRREGIKASAPMFIPFLGAVVSAKSLGKNATAEARVGLAGPVLGSLGAAALIPVYLLTGDELWRALAFTGFFLNLINLLPVVPLDGGRAMAALSPWMWLVGYALLVAA